jgi:hypothetical protein
MSSLRTNVLRRLPSQSVTEQEARFNPQDAESRAVRASQLLDDPILMTAFDLVEANAIEAALAATDDDTRRHATDRVTIARAVRAEIEGIVTNAKSAARERLNLP